MTSLKSHWIDRRREPTQASDPKYPNGIDVDLSRRKSVATCQIDLKPYPAPRCGYHQVHCMRCGYTAIVTTSGRPDDPRSVKVPCKPAGVL